MDEMFESKISKQQGLVVERAKEGAAAWMCEN